MEKVPALASRPSRFVGLRWGLWAAQGTLSFFDIRGFALLQASLGGPLLVRMSLDEVEVFALDPAPF